LTDPGDGEIRIDVRAAGVNPLDCKTRAGVLKRIERHRMPVVLGNECSGVVSAIGCGVTRFAVGDEVMVRLAKNRIGGFAEHVVTDASLAAPKPRTATFAQAAALPLASLTAWQALTEAAALRSGERVLVHSGAGGVGSSAVQLAKHLGARVAATASSRNVDFVRSLGADEVIDYTRDDFSRALRGYDVVLDTLGGEVQRRSFRVLARGGRLVSIAGMPSAAALRERGAGAIAVAVIAIDTLPRALRARAAGVRYRYVFMRPDGAQLAEIGALVDRGVLRILIDRSFPLEAARNARGKVVLEIGPAPS
jgi:NADPH:quinone reductase-like Zn-dependent oxidoreductase